MGDFRHDVVIIVTRRDMFCVGSEREKKDELPTQFDDRPEVNTRSANYTQ
jgi:hypothetical protein